jgi:hypothetical protein
LWSELDRRLEVIITRGDDGVDDAVGMIVYDR